MSAVTIGHILSQVILFEERLQETYAGIRDQCVDHGARLLSYYLSRHHRKINRTCGKIDTCAFERIRNTKLPTVVTFSAQSIEILPNVAPQDVTGDQLLATALAYHIRLRELCQTILRERLPLEAAALFDDLANLQDQEVTALEKMRAIDYF